jgi:chemotaxis-related protein WspD
MSDRTQQPSDVSGPAGASVANNNAMLQLLDRPLTGDDLREATERVAQPRSQPAQDVASALLFRIRGEQLAVPATEVARVTQVPVVRRIPHRSNHIIRGLCNIDGELVICGSLRELLELPDVAPVGVSGAVDDSQRRMVVLGPESDLWAVRVDCVQGVKNYETASCKPAPITVCQAMRCFTASLLPLSDDDVATLLDVSQILSGFKAALK